MYHCVKEQFYAPDIGDYTTYGIAVSSVSGGQEQNLRFLLSDLSADAARVTHLAELCTAGQLDPRQLRDVAEDFLTE